MSHKLIYITAETAAQAKDIGRTLVTEKLVACANIIDGATSIYAWEGKIEEDTESLLIAKTTAESVEKVIARVKELHTYECPCIISMSIDAGNEAYLKWIDNVIAS